MRSLENNATQLHTFHFVHSFPEKAQPLVDYPLHIYQSGLAK